MAYADRKLDISIDNVDLLVELDDDAFGSLIDAAVRGDLDKRTTELIKDPKIIERTRLTLVAMKKSVEGQLGAKRAEHVTKTDKTKPEWAAKKDRQQYNLWRAGALRFKSGVDGLLMDVRLEQTRQDPDADRVAAFLKSERTAYLVAYKNLHDVVIEHRDHVCGPECDDQCIADEKLWRAVDHDGVTASIGS